MGAPRQLTSMNEDELNITDGRQSPTAAAVQRGVGRMLRQAGFTSIFELTLANGRRADVLALGAKGDIWIIEIKSSAADYLSDHKWRDYMDYCDRFYFAIPPNMDQQLVDQNTGLIIADAWGAEIIRAADEDRVAPARRKAISHLVARTACARLQAIHDPGTSSFNL